MSEWEEFCESRGYSTDEEDYAKIIGSLDDRGRPALTRQPPPCGMSQSEIADFLKLDAYGVPKGIEIDLVVWTGQCAELTHCSLGGMNTSHDDDLLVRIRTNDGDYHAPIHTLIDHLRSTTKPLQLEDQFVVWDSRAECVDSWHGLAKESFQIQRAGNFSPNGEYLELLHFLDRAKATDHALKPLLVAGSEVKRALAGQIVEFIDASSLPTATLSDTFLVYVSNQGKPLSIPLDGVAAVAAELPTRNGTYLLPGKTIRSVNGPARLTAGAMLMDQKVIYPTYYLREDHGTIYQPVYRKIAVEEIGDHDPSSIFATDGPHPLELNGSHSSDRYVTTLPYVEIYRGKGFSDVMDEDIFSSPD